MTARIEKTSTERGATIRLMGRIQSQHLDELKAIITDHPARVTLDLGEVTLVDIEVVRFLVISERQGVKLHNCPRFIREWMAQNGPTEPRE